MSTLKKLIKLAYEKPEFREKLLPLIKKKSSEEGNVIGKTHLNLGNGGFRLKVLDNGHGPEIQMDTGFLGGMDSTMQLKLEKPSFLGLASTLYKGYLHEDYSGDYPYTHSLDYSDLGLLNYLVVGFDLRINGPFNSETNELLSQDEVDALNTFTSSIDGFKSHYEGDVYYTASISKDHNTLVSTTASSEKEAFLKLHDKVKHKILTLLLENKEEE